MFDITKLPAHYLAVYGAAKVAEVTGQTSSIVAMWTKRNKFPLDAVAKLLEFDPAPLGKIQPLYSNPEPGCKLMILVPLSSPPAPKMMDTLVRLYDRKEMSYERIAFNCLSVSRNSLAAKFLASPADWAWWMDGDSLHPTGDAAWFRENADLPQMPETFAGLNAIYRALWHKKTIVSCCYTARRKGGPLQFGGVTPEIRAKVKGGPRNELIEVPWAGFHGILTHRSVFEDIIKTQGEEIKMKPGGIGERFGYTHGFFNPADGETPGDDVPWCARARKAGHKIYVDLAIQSAHVGDRAFTYADL